MKGIIKVILLLFIILGLTVLVLETTSSYKITREINVHAPVITRQQILIDAPASTVWKIFTDVDNWPKWQKEISKSKINGSFREGTSFDWQTNGLTIHSTLHTAETGHAVGWSGRAFGSFAIHNWYFIPQGNRTLVEVNESMDGWLVQLLKNRFQSGLDVSILNWMEALKSASEHEVKRVGPQ